MESKVDPILNLTAAGRQVSGSGPITKWKNREVRAMVTFVVVQPQPTSVAANPVRLVVAAGASDWFPKGAANWWAAGGVLASDPPPGGRPRRCLRTSADPVRRQRPRAVRLGSLRRASV